MNRAARGPGAAGVSVRVPATSANLGPGFDACGLALGLYDDLTVVTTDSGLSIDVTGEDDGARDETHLIARAVRAGLDALGLAPPGLGLTCVNRIPHGRGLGSSAAAIVAGLLAASALGEGRLTAMDVFALACQIEGHPDNVAPALFGGFTVAWYDDAGHPQVVRTNPPDDLRPVAFIPVRRQATSAARAALPVTVLHADAAANAGRAALLAMAMSGTLHPETVYPETVGTEPGNRQERTGQPDYNYFPGARLGNDRSGPAPWVDALLAATDDRLHQPYRLPSMPETRDLLSQLRAAGLAAVLSGSGPTVLALAVGAEQADVARACGGGGFTVLDLPVDRDGARVRLIAG